MEGLNKTNQRCATCLFCVKKEIKSESMDKAGYDAKLDPDIVYQCQRYAPGAARSAILAPFGKAGGVQLATNNISMKMVVVNAWTEVKPSDWCGEYMQELRRTVLKEDGSNELNAYLALENLAYHIENSDNLDAEQDEIDLILGFIQDAECLVFETLSKEDKAWLDSRPEFPPENETEKPQ